MSVAKSFRLDEGLVERYEARARELGQSYTTFLVRALEQALGLEGSRLPVEHIAPLGPAPARAPVRVQKEVVIASLRPESVVARRERVAAEAAAARRVEKAARLQS